MRLHLVVVLAAAAALASCVQQPQPLPSSPPPPPSPPSEAVRAELGVVRLTVKDEPSPQPSPQPATSVGAAALSGAAKGAIVAFVLPVYAGCGTGDGYACAGGLTLGIFLAPIGALVGAIAGTIEGQSSENVVAAQGALTGRLQASDPTAALRVRVPQQAQERIGATLISDGGLPAEPQPDASPAIELVLTVEGFRVEAVGSAAASLTFMLNARGELRRIQDGTLVHAQRWRYESDPLRYRDVTSDDGAAPGPDLDALYDALALKIVEDIFIATEIGDQRVENGRITTTRVADDDDAAVAPPARCPNGLTAATCAAADK